MNLTQEPLLRFQPPPVEDSLATDLLGALFSLAIRECRSAIEGIKNHDAEAKGRAVNKAIEAVETLGLALDHSVAPEICAHLEVLYSFLIRQLSLANLRFDSRPVEECLVVLTTLSEAFAEAIQSVEAEETFAQSQLPSSAEETRSPCLAERGGGRQE